MSVWKWFAAWLLVGLAGAQVCVAQMAAVKPMVAVYGSLRSGHRWVGIAGMRMG